MWKVEVIQRSTDVGGRWNCGYLLNANLPEYLGGFIQTETCKDEDLGTTDNERMLRNYLDPLNLIMI